MVKSVVQGPRPPSITGTDLGSGDCDIARARKSRARDGVIGIRLRCWLSSGIERTAGYSTAQNDSRCSSFYFGRDERVLAGGTSSFVEVTDCIVFICLLPTFIVSVRGRRIYFQNRHLSDEE